MIRKWILRFLNQWEGCDTCNGRGVVNIEVISNRGMENESKVTITNVECPICKGWTFRRKK